MQYTEFASWISIGDYFQMNYNVGVDGISLWLVLLTTFIMPIAMLSTWHAIDKEHQGLHGPDAAARNRHAGCVYLS